MSFDIAKNAPLERICQFFSSKQWDYLRIFELAVCFFFKVYFNVSKIFVFNFPAHKIWFQQAH